MELRTQIKKQDEDGAPPLLISENELLVYNMAAERPQGGLEVDFTCRRPSGIIQLNGLVNYNS